MRDNCDKYGFTWEMQSEPWHIRYFMAESIPAAVQEWIDSHANRDLRSAD
jgi:hypothetical protein